MDIYLQYLEDVLKNGRAHKDRTGIGTRRVFGRQLRFDLSEKFPILTTKRVWFRGVVAELLWFLDGETNIRPLVKNDVSIWTDWPLKRYRSSTGHDISKDAFEGRIESDDQFAERWGDLGPTYGKQWRDFAGPKQRIDQISRLIKRLKTKPFSRRHLVSAWHPAQISDTPLPPCHYAFQCFVEGEPSNGGLSLMWQQRSVDSFLGLPFNISSYALLTHMLAQQCNLQPRQLIFSGGDCHIYNNHIEQVKTQLSRSPLPLPSLKLSQRDSIFEYNLSDISLDGYQHHPAIEAPIAV